MREHVVRPQAPGKRLPRGEQLAWALAELATERVEPDAEVTAMVVNRLVDNAAVAVASLVRHPVASAREQALVRPSHSGGGATIFGLPPEERAEPEWAAWANCVAVRELDFHDTFLGAEYAHPGDNIPPLLAVAQQNARSGTALCAAIAMAYEVQIDLAKAISLHAHKIDHVAHLGP